MVVILIVFQKGKILGRELKYNEMNHSNDYMSIYAIVKIVQNKMF